MHHRWQPTENILTSLLLFSFIINFSLSWLEWLYSLFRPFVSVPFVSFPPFSCDRSATGCRPVDDDQFGATERNVSRTDRSYHAPTIRRTSSLPPVRSRILAQKNVFPPFWAYSIELSLSLSLFLSRSRDSPEICRFPTRPSGDSFYPWPHVCPRKAPLYFGFRKSYVIDAQTRV